MINIKYRQQKLYFYIKFFSNKQYKNLPEKQKIQKKKEYNNFIKTFYRNDLSNKTEDKYTTLLFYTNSLEHVLPSDFRPDSFIKDLTELNIYYEHEHKTSRFIFTEKI